jgi:hypothetical protein
MSTNTPTKTKKANVLKAAGWTVMEHPVPESLLRAAGMLRHKKKSLERHLNTIRNEWEKRDVQKSILKK